jgi:hypothetical protein
LLDLLDDATRYNVGARLYHAETLLAHFDFLPRAFQAHGLPLTPCGSHLCALCTSAFKVCSKKEKTGLVSQGMAEEAGEFE